MMKGGEGVMQIEITPTVAAVARDAMAQAVDRNGEVMPGDPMWPIQFELMQAYHRFADVAGR